jgi:hypothetical protein
VKEHSHRIEEWHTRRDILSLLDCVNHLAAIHIAGSFLEPFTRRVIRARGGTSYRLTRVVYCVAMVDVG